MASRLPEDAALALAAARLLAVERMPYLAVALFSLHPVNTPGLGTFAVDAGWRLYVDPAALQEWGPDASAAVLIHEVFHLLRDHHTLARTLGVDDDTARAWNLAADAAINDDIGEGLPDPVLPAHLGLPDGLCEQEYFAALRTAGSPGGPGPDEVAGRPGTGALDGGCDCGSGVDGLPRPWDAGGGGAPLVDDRRAERIREQVRSDAAAAGLDAGSVPGGVRRWAEPDGPPAVDWRRVLARTVTTARTTAAAGAEPSWARPHRRRGGTTRGDVLFPSTRRREPQVAVVVDTSASMDRELLGRALVELDGVARVCGNQRGVRLLTVDVEAHDLGWTRRPSTVDLIGGGGTDLRIGIDTAASLQPRPDLIVVLTDGYTPWPHAAPAGPRLVVAIVGPGPAPDIPGAVVIHVDDDG